MNTTHALLIISILIAVYSFAIAIENRASKSISLAFWAFGSGMALTAFLTAVRLITLAAIT